MDLTKAYNGPCVRLAVFLGSTPDSEVHKAPVFLELSGGLTVSWVLRNYFIFKLCIYLSVCLWGRYVHIGAGVLRGQGKVLDALELEFHVVVSCLL